jgi:hypothetical protein
MMQLVEENKSLWRIKNDYKKDSECKECQEIWKRLEREKEDTVRELSKLVKNHMR